MELMMMSRFVTPCHALSRTCHALSRKEVFLSCFVTLCHASVTLAIRPFRSNCLLDIDFEPIKAKRKKGRMSRSYI